MLRVALILLTAAVAAQAPIADEETAASATRPALLQALDGHWVMTGDVMGEAVTYDLGAAPTLNGAFRETLTFDPESGSWSLDIQAEQPDGTWQHFARYEMRRR